MKLGVSENLYDDEKIINDILGSYKRYPNILVTKKLKFQKTSVSKVKELINIDVKKVTGIDSILPKVVKMSSDIIAKVFTTEINNCLTIHTGKKRVLSSIQYKNSLKYKVSCFWHFSYVYTIN